MRKNIYNIPWFVYILECQDKTLYVGIALDVLKRFKEHSATNKCRYTRCRKPLKLMYQEECLDYHFARSRESEIRKLSRKKKLKLIGIDKDLLP
ncbi:MAG: GIY-YIG nuclease family protein [Candidatus Omnitrophica bacterium]|nr:GIY-YIG nuclease family protein [Candidatus Omnitrophota bacterium]